MPELTETPRAVRSAPSWPLATWVAPVVPALTLWLLVLVGSHTELTDGRSGGETGGYLLGLACALVVGAVGWLLSRLRGARLRGVGLGLLAGAAAMALFFVVLVVT